MSRGVSNRSVINFARTVIYYFITGMSSRVCDYGGVWLQPNVSTCLTKKFVDLKNKVIRS